MLPVRVEHISDLLDVHRVVGDDPVVAGEGEVLDHQVVGGHHGGPLVDDDRLLVGHVEMRAGPLDVHAGVLQLLVGLVVGAVARRTLGIEHDPDVHSGPVPVDGGVDQARFGEGELFDKQGALGTGDEGVHRI